MTPTSKERRSASVSLNSYIEWVEFRDSDGVLWRRLGDGQLIKQPSRPIRYDTAYAR
jgi:hypothetical protein